MERFRSHVWWMVPTLGVAVAVGLALGYPLIWLGYAVFNILGVWLYCDSKGSQRRTRQTWMKALSIVMLPVGVIGIFASGSGGHTPAEAATYGSGDETTRHETARAASRGASGSGTFGGGA